jgi:hypothetical protein
MAQLAEAADVLGGFQQRPGRTEVRPQLLGLKSEPFAAVSSAGRSQS